MAELGLFSAGDLPQASSFPELIEALAADAATDIAFCHADAGSVALTPDRLVRGRNLFGPAQSPAMTQNMVSQHHIRAVSSVVVNHACFSPSSLTVLDARLWAFREGIDNVTDPARLADFDDSFTRTDDGSALVAERLQESAERADAGIVALPVCSHRFFNFGHFQIDGLPGVLLHTQLLRDRLPAGLVLRIVGPPLRGWQAEVLEALGLTGLYLPLTRPTLFRKLLTTTMLSMHLSYPTRFIRPVFDALRFAFGVDAQPGPQRVFLSRGRVDGNRRVLRNREAVEAMLEARGFHIAHPHLMSVRDQVRLMASARLAVGEIGEALTNFGYCDPGARLLAIQPDLFTDGWPRAQAFLLGQQWHLYLARAGRAEAAQGRHDEIAYDLDPDELAAALDTIEEARPMPATPRALAPTTAVAQPSEATPASYLLSDHGTLICRDRRTGRVCQQPLHWPADHIVPMTIDLDVTRGRDDPARLLAPSEAPLGVPMSGGDLAGFTAQLSDDRSHVTLARGTLFMSAEYDSDRVTLDRTEAHDWERFVLLSAADLAGLRMVLANDWVRRGTLELVKRSAVALSQNHILRFGGLDFLLRHQLPLQGAPTPFRLTLLREGWRIEDAALYRPLIYFSAFGHPVVFEQLYLALKSLLVVGRYTGHIHVITDGSAEQILARVPEIDPLRFTTRHLSLSDRTGYLAARYSLADWPGAADFQPILYVDVDSIFNMDVQPMLIGIAASDRICAPLEQHSPLATAPQVGASLIQHDGYDTGFAIGFNSGTLGIPNLASHAATLRLIHRIIMNHAEDMGRGSLNWIDQPFANYVSFRLAHFDTRWLSRHVTHGWPDTDTANAPRTGLIHFWPRGDAQQRLEVMRDYMLTLGIE